MNNGDLNWIANPYEVHNGSSLITGDAGQGESNIRRWIIENDWLEAIRRPAAQHVLQHPHRHLQCWYPEGQGARGADGGRWGRIDCGRTSSRTKAEESAHEYTIRRGEADRMMDWSACPAVERSPKKISGAWAFAGTRVPVYALFENLAGGATIDEFVEWFPGVDKKQVRAVLEHEARALRETLAH